MAPFDLDGLNVVQPAQEDTQDLAPPFPDFSAHLDLWTNLAFESDEPPGAQKHKLDEEDDPDSPAQDAILPPAPSAPPPLDINALLAGVGIDPLLMPILPPPPVQRAAPVPSLAQLLALHAVHATHTTTPPAAAALSTSAPSTSNSPPSKRSRAQKTSSPTDNNSSEAHSPSSTSEEQAQSTTSLSVTEDKRRRNTAASARFRLKKKEREAALERRAKELEDRVIELERECEGLRRENGWLKGLVVGVTGAGAAQHQQATAK